MTSKLAELAAQVSALQNALAASLKTAPAAVPAAIPDWVQDARTSVPPRANGNGKATAAPVAPKAARSWTRIGTAQSRSNRPLVVFQTTMVNGGTYKAQIPADLVAAIKAGA